jgi:hypothetical protein
MTVGDLRRALEKQPASSKLVVYSYGTEHEVTRVEVMPSVTKTILVLVTKERRS